MPRERKGIEDVSALSKFSVSVVVPVFGSATTLNDLVERTTATLDGTVSEYEIILVDDGSPQETWDVCADLGRSNTKVRSVRLMRNFGQHNALLCGIRLAAFSTVVTIDDDLQTPPEEIPKLLAELTSDVDVVYGTKGEEHYGLARGLATRVTKMVLKNAVGADIAAKITSFRALRTELRDGFADFTGPYTSIDVLLTWSTERFATVPVRHDERIAGTSGYTFRKLVTHTLNLVTGFTVFPLQLAGLIGFVAVFLGLIILAYVLGRFFVVRDALPGFTFLASSVVIFSGAQLLALGIIGEYLARMHFRSMDRPVFVVRTDTNNEPGTQTR